MELNHDIMFQKYVIDWIEIWAKYRKLFKKFKWIVKVILPLSLIFSFEVGATFFSIFCTDKLLWFWLRPLLSLAEGNTLEMFADDDFYGDEKEEEKDTLSISPGR